jgi:3-deoxy-7-phosphoheptulonate synthase
MWENVPNMSMASIAAGADGLMIEAHNSPEDALSDGYQSLKPKKLKILLGKLKQLAPIMEREI